jgi:hypothetical protein
MKLRNGFVSNSSSSSFVIGGKDLEDVTNTIKNLLKSEEYADEKFYTSSKSRGKLRKNLKVKDICTITKLTAKEADARDKETRRIFKKSKHIDLPYFLIGKRECVVVDSVSDNSIPWDIQDYLELLGRKIHWG